MKISIIEALSTWLIFTKVEAARISVGKTVTSNFPSTCCNNQLSNLTDGNTRINTAQMV
mgnify:CR=1 FL=1